MFFSHARTSFNVWLWLLLCERAAPCTRTLARTFRANNFILMNNITISSENFISLIRKCCVEMCAQDIKRIQNVPNRMDDAFVSASMLVRHAFWLSWLSIRFCEMQFHLLCWFELQTLQNYSIWLMLHLGQIDNWTLNNSSIQAFQWHTLWCTLCETDARMSAEQFTYEHWIHNSHWKSNTSRTHLKWMISLSLSIFLRHYYSLGRSQSH